MPTGVSARFLQSTAPLRVGEKTAATHADALPNRRATIFHGRTAQGLKCKFSRWIGVKNAATHADDRTELAPTNFLTRLNPTTRRP